MAPAAHYTKGQYALYASKSQARSLEMPKKTRYTFMIWNTVYAYF